MNHDELIIREQLSKLLRIWAGSIEECMDECMDEEIWSYFSIFENSYTRDELLHKFRQTSDSQMQFEVLQENCSIQGSNAYQHAIVIALIRNKNHHICVAGTFLNHLVKENESWKFHTLRFELQSDNGYLEQSLTADGQIITTPGVGDRNLINKWLMVNDRVGFFMDPVKGQGSHVILGEADSPWYCVPTPENTKNDEESVLELFDRFCFAYDYATLLLLVNVTTDDFTVFSENAGQLDKHQAFGYFRILRQGSPRSFTGGIMENLTIDGETASSQIDYYAPEKYQSTGDSMDNWLDKCKKSSYSMKFRKENGIWKICQMDFD